MSEEEKRTRWQYCQPCHNWYAAADDVDSDCEDSLDDDDDEDSGDDEDNNGDDDVKHRYSLYRTRE